jgi:protein-tyrosine phosphatase
VRGDPLTPLIMVACRKLIFLYILGFRMRAIAILGREVMLPRGLVGLGTDTLDHCGPEINDVSSTPGI